MIPLKLLGIVLGTHEGWDQSGDTSFNFYNFKSSIDGLENANCLDFSWETGELKSYDDNGETVWSRSLLSVIS